MITPGYYSSKALQDMPYVLQMAEQCDLDSGYKKLVRIAARILESGPKFVLPDYGDVGLGGGQVTQDIFDMARLPYDGMVIEYPCPRYSIDKRIVMCSKHGDDGFVLSTVVLVDDGSHKLWVPQPILQKVDYSQTISGGCIAGKFMFFCKNFEQIMRIEGEEIEDFLRSEIARDAYTVLFMLAALNAANVKTVNIVPSAQLNKKRRKKGKRPLDTYKVLDIFLSKNNSGGDYGHSMKRGNNRLHTCRGHFKKINGKLYWWNAQVRGGGVEGSIKKGYAVHA
jgi:hypothetical protein